MPVSTLAGRQHARSSRWSTAFGSATTARVSGGSGGDNAKLRRNGDQTRSFFGVSPRLRLLICFGVLLVSVGRASGSSPSPTGTAPPIPVPTAVPIPAQTAVSIPAPTPAPTSQPTITPNPTATRLAITNFSTSVEKNSTACVTVEYESTVVTAPLETALSEMDCYTAAVTNDSEFSVQPTCSCGVIDLSDRDLTGTIPSALGNCTEVTKLILYNNLLTGTIPNVLSALTNLSTLIVHDNSLTGTIPLELSHLAGLRNLTLYSNSLTGAVPSAWCDSSTLETCDLVTAPEPSNKFYCESNKFYCESDCCDLSQNASCVPWPMAVPTQLPSDSPTPAATPGSIYSPTPVPTTTPIPTPMPIPHPTSSPSPVPAPEPTNITSSQPTAIPTSIPTSSQPTAYPPVVRIVEPALTIVNADSRIVFGAAVTSGSSSVKIRWFSEALNVSDPTLFGTSHTSLWLVTKPFVLVENQRYTFHVVATDALGHTGLANITIAVNSAPTNGTLVCSPNSGWALTTDFRLLTFEWVDSENDLPLTYQFNYVSASTGGQVILSGDGSSVLNCTKLPIGNNLTLQTTATDIHGGASTAFAYTNVWLKDDMAYAIGNATAAVADRMTAGDDESAISEICACADTMNSIESWLSWDTATAWRSDLLGLLVEASRGIVTTTAANVALRSATLAVLTEAPSRLSDDMQWTAVKYAQAVANSSRALGSVPSPARSSIVNALAATIDAGILTSTNRTTTASEEIEATLLQLHLLSLPDLAPGESQLVTKGSSIALASSVLACPWGNCEASYVQSPAVTSHATANASFVLPWSVVAEVTARVGACALDAEETTEVGVQAVTWGCVRV